MSSSELVAAIRRYAAGFLSVATSLSQDDAGPPNRNVLTYSLNDQGYGIKNRILLQFPHSNSAIRGDGDWNAGSGGKAECQGKQ